jgi:hypothetical protein
MANELTWCPACGKDYWQTQAWQHEECKKQTLTVVANVSATWLTGLDNAKKPSYKYRDPEARKKYMRELMKKRRAKAA